MKQNKFVSVFFIIAISLFVLDIATIIIFSVLDMESSFYNSLNVASLLIAFVSFVASSFFSLSVYQQSKNQNRINESLPKKDDQYIIANYSLFNLEREISFFTLTGEERAQVLASERTLGEGDEVVRLVFLPTDSMNKPTYKVLVHSISFLSPTHEELYSAVAGEPVDCDYSANVLSRGYNCICVDLLSSFKGVCDLFSRAEKIEIKLDIISVFNVKMTSTFSVHLDGEKDVSNNPDKNKISDLTTYTVHHSNYYIEDKSILTDNF